jgi:hypothetical protein
MVYRPLRHFGRFVLAACAVSLGVASLSAQTAPSTAAPTGPNPSRFDLFLGYSYFGAHGQVKPAGINYSSRTTSTSMSAAKSTSSCIRMARTTAWAAPAPA